MTVRLLETQKTDAELAAQLRAEARIHLDQLCAIMNRAKSAGLSVGFQIQEEFGRAVCHRISIMRHL